MNAHTQTITINTAPKVVFDFVANPENLPKWAVVFCRGLRHEESRWIVTTPEGDMVIRYESDAKTGAIDMYVTVSPSVESPAFSRVLANGEGSEYVFTFFQPPGLPDEEFRNQTEALKKELGVLKGLLEA
ncbi:MAG: SRPBCC family protein [Nitrospirota bacterium]